MKNCNFRAVAIIVAISLLTGCGAHEGVEDNNLGEKEPELIEIEDLSDAWGTILNSATKEFIGGHPIDESFLMMITSEYGEETIKEIASYANFTTPEIWYKLTGKSVHVLWYEYCKQTGIEAYDNRKTYLLPNEDGGDIVIDFTGDVSLADSIATTNYMDQQEEGILDCFSGDLLFEMQSADILMVNNEFAYTSRGQALQGKAYTFRANPSRVGFLKELGVDCVSVANNHVYDYDTTGFLDTLDTLRNAAMPYVGAGVDLKEAAEPLYFVVGGRKIAIIATTQIERTLNYTKEATPDSPGVLKCLHPELVCQIIKKAKTNADYVIVVPHWGTEGNAYYGSDQVSLARSFVEAGADVIVGGHTHCLQTVEYMDDVPIFYSLGNFWFSTTALMPSDYSTGIAQIRITPDGEIETYFIPCHFSNGVTTMLSSEDEKYSDIINSLNGLSSSAVIDEQGHIKEDF